MNPVIFFPVAGERAWSPDEYMTRGQLAGVLKVSVDVVDRWAHRPVDPLPSVCWGARLVRFNVRDTEDWLRRQEREKAA